MLDLTSFKKAINSLKAALKVACEDKETEQMSKEAQDTIRAGVIQNFEFTYELCWKFLKRWLGNSLGDVYVDGVSRRELFRLGVEHHLINDVDRWMEYHDKRNETSHTYDEATAEEVFDTAIGFLKDAEKLYSNLEKEKMINASQSQLEEIKKILHAHVPESEVRVFGSRLSDKAKNYADLDLAIVGKGKLAPGKMAALREAFEESTLPFRIDLLDWHRISDNFKKIIQEKCLIIQAPAQP